MRFWPLSFAIFVLALAGAPAAHAATAHDVFRPWSLAPAACAGTCSGAVSGGAPVNLKTWYDAKADANPATVERVVYGTSRGGQELVAYRVAGSAESRPVALYAAAQHGRDWLAVELQRRLFSYAVSHVSDFPGSALWFVPVVNPDGYDATFAGDRDSATTLAGVDTDRNWPDHWRYDDEGSSDEAGATGYRGPHAGSEPEVARLDLLLARLEPAYLLEYQAGDGKIVYPESWQIQTPATDTPALAALAGDDDDPAIAGYDPDPAGEVAIANGTLIDYAHHRYGTQAFAVQLSGGHIPDDDSESDIEAEFQKNLDFALDLARSAPDPSDPVSHLHNHAPDFVAHEFPLSYGSPQTVEVNARRALGAVTLHWRVEGDATVHSAATREYAGGERSGAPGAVYHRMRGTVSGFAAGDDVEVWFEAGGAQSDRFTFSAAQARAADVLVLAAEDYTGTHPGTPHSGPRYLDYYTGALDALGVSHDVYDVDARDRVAPDALGVLSHYAAVVWYTGDDVFVRDPGQPASTGVSRLAGDEVLAARDFLNDGGRLLVSGQQALAGAWVDLLYNPIGGPSGPYCRHNNFRGSDDNPLGQVENCVPLANDFLQYYLGAYLNVAAAPDGDAAGELPYLAGAAFRVNGHASAANQQSPALFVTTSSFLDPARFPTFASSAWVHFDRPPAFEPTSGAHYAYAASEDTGYQRLRRVVDLRDATTGSLTFKVSYDTELDYDYVFVEAHEVGQSDWTTLPDRNGHTSDAVLGGSCDFDWNSLHPFIDHYQTNPTSADDCTPSGTTGDWNAASGNSGGFQTWDVDLSQWAGKRVGIAITYAQDEGIHGLGVYLDDVETVRDGHEIESQGFEGGLGEWRAGPPPAGDASDAAWTSGGRVGYVDAPGVATADTLLWGFGLEGVTGAGARARLLGDALAYLRRRDDSAPGPGDGGTPPPPPPPRTPAPKRHRAPAIVSLDRLRADREGLVRVKVKCSSPIACTGALRLTRRLGLGVRVLARRIYWVKAGRTDTVALRLTPAARRSLARAGSLKPTLTLANGSGKRARVMSKHRITVLAPGGTRRR